MRDISLNRSRSNPLGGIVAFFVVLLLGAGIYSMTGGDDAAAGTGDKVVEVPVDVPATPPPPEDPDKTPQTPCSIGDLKFAISTTRKVGGVAESPIVHAVLKHYVEAIAKKQRHFAHWLSNAMKLERFFAEEVKVAVELGEQSVQWISQGRKGVWKVRYTSKNPVGLTPGGKELFTVEMFVLMKGCTGEVQTMYPVP